MTNDMNANVKLQAVEAALKERGVVDVKFFFNKEGGSPTKVANDVVNVLNAMLDGKTLPFNGVGDSRRAA
ncbi:hypothetical protein CMZ84_04445 [Lysobacteraceae bacterium NML93-0399]|nr:hypothetical protein CMZ84_04445 [Xanthomonadaceae bacterium NML93-0399]